MQNLNKTKKNFKVARIVDLLAINQLKPFSNPLKTAELGGGAHPDRYDELFARLLTEPNGAIDWVDISQIMLELAREYIQTDVYKPRESVINFVEAEILDYLAHLDDDLLDLALMKCTFDYIKDIDLLFNLLSQKLKKGASMVATVSVSNSQLKSFSTNARFLYNGQQFPDDEVRELRDGDYFGVKFFKTSGNPKDGYLEGAETIKYYHSHDKIMELAQKYGFEVFIGNWKDYLTENQTGIDIDQEVLVLTRVK